MPCVPVWRSWSQTRQGLETGVGRWRQPPNLSLLSLVALACRAVGQLLPGSSSLQVWQIPTPRFKGKMHITYRDKVILIFNLELPYNMPRPCPHPEHPALVRAPQTPEHFVQNLLCYRTSQSICLLTSHLPREDLAPQPSSPSYLGSLPLMA